MWTVLNLYDDGNVLDKMLTKQKPGPSVILPFDSSMNTYLLHISAQQFLTALLIFVQTFLNANSENGGSFFYRVSNNSLYAHQLKIYICRGEAVWWYSSTKLPTIWPNICFTNVLRFMDVLESLALIQISAHSCQVLVPLNCVPFNFSSSFTIEVI